MSLASRVTLFFVAALALALASFSVALWFAADHYLHVQAQERLEAAQTALIAAVEFEPGGLKWEPDERRLSVGLIDDPEEARWLIRDEQGQIVDRSVNFQESAWPALPAVSETAAPTWKVSKSGDVWQIRREVLSGLPGLRTPKRSKLYPKLELTSAISLNPTNTLLGKLAFLLAVISAAILLVAALLGRRYCRAALLPLRRMTDSARLMGGDNWLERLPSRGTHDEMDELGHSFNGLLDRLQDAFERQRRFTGEASHQLRTPLTAMLGQVEVSLRRARASEDYRSTLELVHRQAQQMHGIVEMLLFLARADAESATPELASIDLSSWLPAHLASWTSHVRAKDIKLEFAEDCSFLARIHEVLFGQLLNNLLDNACKYSPEGSSIVIRVERVGLNCCCSVRDSGIGIDAEDLKHVFEPFFRSSQSRERGISGAGLGLAIARRIARRFGGDVLVESTIQEGSVFTIRLPLVEDGSQENSDATSRLISSV